MIRADRLRSLYRELAMAVRAVINAAGTRNEGPEGAWMRETVERIENLDDGSGRRRQPRTRPRREAERLRMYDLPKGLSRRRSTGAEARP